MNELTAIKRALNEVLNSVGIDESDARDVTISGDDPVFRTRYKIAAAGSAALGGMAVAMANLRQMQTGARPAISIDAAGAAASLRSSKYVRLNGEPPQREEVMTGFYRTANDRWSYFHCNHPPHQQALLRVLNVPADKEQVAQAAAGWDAFALEEAMNQAGGLGPVVRTPEEWRALPNTSALSTEPLIQIRKIADSAPIPIPQGRQCVLEGLKVLDLTRVLAGPTCGRILAENGADVIKITCDAHPDTAILEWDTGYGKRQVTMDIATGPGRDKFIDLIKNCDVLSQAYRPGALAKLGFGPEDVSSLRPGIIYTSLNAFGHTGEWKQRRGFDTVVQSASGMAYTSRIGEKPQFLPVSALDYIAGYFMTTGVLAALKRRHEKGGSFAVNVSLARCAQWLIEMGLHDEATVDAAHNELPDIDKWLTEVDTPLGMLTRLRPIVRYSEDQMNQLIDWQTRTEDGLSWLSEH